MARTFWDSPIRRERRAGRYLAAFLLLGLPWVMVAAEAEKKKTEKQVNLNTATATELASLPGIGDAIAARIIRHREKSGRFRSVDELLVVRGISRKKLDVLRPYVVVDAKAEKKAEEED